MAAKVTPDGLAANPAIVPPRWSFGGTFLKSSLALVSGTVVSQGVVFLASPILSRIFGLADFGNLASYNAWVSMLALLSSLRYEHALIVTDDRQDTNAVLALTIVLCTTSAAVLAIAATVIVLAHPQTGYLGAIAGFILVIPVGVLTIGLSSALIQVTVKAGAFRPLAFVAVGQVAVTLACQIAFGVLKLTNGLIFGTIAGSLFGSAVLAWLSARDGRLAGLWSNLTSGALAATIRRHINFPKYTLAADSLNVLLLQFTPVFIIGLFNPALAGLYAFSVRIVRVPLLVVSTALNSVLRREGREFLDRHGNLQPLFTSIVKALGLIGLGPFLVILFFGDRIFATVFGSQWTDAGRIVQILSPGILMEFIAFPLSVFFLLTGSQRYALTLQFFGFLGMVGALFVGRYYFNDFTKTCYLISATMVTINCAGIALAGRVSRLQQVDSLRSKGGAEPDTGPLIPVDTAGPIP